MSDSNEMNAWNNLVMNADPTLFQAGDEMQSAALAVSGKHYNTKRPHNTLGNRPPALETIVPMEPSSTMHVWMRPVMQADFEQRKYVIGCGHVLGLLMRH